MKSELAEGILKAVVDWDVDRFAKELQDIQVIAEYKYNDYQQYTHGMRYVESLALWLRKFSPSEIDIAYTSQIAITSWTRRGKNLGHGWSRRIYP